MSVYHCFIFIAGAAVIERLWLKIFMATDIVDFQIHVLWMLAQVVAISLEVDCLYIHG
jgi:hypothetical protein